MEKTKNKAKQKKENKRNKGKRKGKERKRALLIFSVKSSHAEAVVRGIVN